MKSIFSIKHFCYPYKNMHFPGQHSEEKILFITREGKIILSIKLLTTAIISLTGFFIGIISLNNSTFLNYSLSGFILFFIFIWIIGSIIIYWWIYKVWQKSIFIITTRRLTKFIHTTPWSRYQMSLGLDRIVDTGAYQKGFFQMFTGLGYFVARSSAGNIKNFKLINIGFAEDLHNYVNKLLFVFNEKTAQLDKFRPFIPFLKGEARDNFVRKTTPKYAKPLPSNDSDKN